jgi:hypothetical protein
LTRTGRIWLDSVARFPLHNTPKKILVKVIQWNLCNPTKIYGPRVFLLISIPTTCKIWHISLVSWFVGLDRFHWSNIPYNVVILEYQQQPLNFPSIKQCNEITNTFVSESLIFSQCLFLACPFPHSLGFHWGFPCLFSQFSKFDIYQPISLKIRKWSFITECSFLSSCSWLHVVFVHDK